MKDFIKWLGINEKIAKIVVWLLIIMCSLIIINTALDSLGFPYYKLTTANLKNINYPKILEYILSWTLSLLSFFSIIFLVFRIKDFKKILKYAIIYLIVNYFGRLLTNTGINQLIIFTYTMGFCYFYSGKKLKYLMYGIGSILFNTLMQYVFYLFKVQFIDYTSTNYAQRFLLSLDFFIIMIVIILVKEIIIKKRENRKIGEQND